MTDEFPSYRGLDREFARHRTVNHSVGEYVRDGAYTNTVESFFSLLKRGIVGAYHHVSKEHLHRYLAEFDFRFTARRMSDGERTMAAIRGAAGKRLTYREPLEAS